MLHGCALFVVNFSGKQASVIVKINCCEISRAIIYLSGLNSLKWHYSTCKLPDHSFVTNTIKIIKSKRHVCTLPTFVQGRKHWRDRGAPSVFSESANGGQVVQVVPPWIIRPFYVPWRACKTDFVKIMSKCFRLVSFCCCFFLSKTKIYFLQ